MPHLIQEFKLFTIEKHTKVTELCTFAFEGIDYSLIKHGENIGYIPSSFLVESLYSLPQFNQYETATITNRDVKVYSDSAFLNECDTLLAGSSVVITEVVEGGYHVIYGENKSGYVLTQSIRKKGSFINRNVTVIILLSISLAVTAVYFEMKNLYKKTKLSSPIMRKK